MGHGVLPWCVARMYYCSGVGLWEMERWPIVGKRSLYGFVAFVTT